jgi:hypothetical protein
MNLSKVVAAFLIVVLGFASSALPEVTFSISVVDPDNDAAGYLDDLETCLLAAAREWGSYFDGDANIEIELSFDRIANVLMYAGAYTSVYQYNSSDGYMVYDWCTSQEIQSGFDVNSGSPDATVAVNPDFFSDFYFDPSPGSGTPSVPSNKYDAYSVFLHELGHAFVFNGWLEQDGAGLGLPAFDEDGNPIPPGRPQRVYVVDEHKRLCCSKVTSPLVAALTPPSNYISVYDTFVQDGGSIVTFVGPKSEEVSPGGVPLDPDSYAHLADPGSVMHTYAYPGVRERLTGVELAVAEDCGIPVQSSADSGGGGVIDDGDGGCVTEVDTDGDGFDDCVDECPFDATRSELGECGCEDCPVDDNGDTDPPADDPPVDDTDDDPSDDEVLSDAPDSPPSPGCGTAPIMIPLLMLMVVALRITSRRR